MKKKPLIIIENCSYKKNIVPGLLFKQMDGGIVQ